VISCSTARNSTLLSVIIPTHNRAKTLAGLLDSLAAQTPVPFEWEVIVVDNASTDDTAAVVRRKSEALPVPTRYVLEPCLGLHRGRHRGAREARGEYLGYLDDDTLVTPAWVQGIDLLAQANADAVVSRILPRWEAEPPDWLLGLFHDGALEYLTLLDLGTVPRPVDPSMVWGASFFIRRSLVFDLGGFHPDSMPPEMLRYRGDGETALMRKFKEARLTAWYDPRPAVYHVIGADRMTVEYLCKRAYNQGVSDSFSQIRATHLGQAFHQVGTVERQTELSSHARRVKTMSVVGLVRAVARRLKQSAAPVPSLEDEIQNRLNESHMAGWQFHQDAVKNDRELWAYVTRNSYLDD